MATLGKLGAGVTTGDGGRAGKFMGAKDGGGLAGSGAPAGGGISPVVMSENGLFSGGLTWGTGFAMDVPEIVIVYSSLIINAEVVTN